MNLFFSFQNSRDTYSPCFDRNAQSILEGFQEDLPPWNVETDCGSPDPLAEKVLKAANRRFKTTQKKKRSYIQEKPYSYLVKSAPTKGRRLIKIEIRDLESDDCREIISAQYVVSDNIDHVMDQAEVIINAISKNICGYSHSF